MNAPLPVLFVAHGAPTLVRDPVRGGELARWSASIPRPESLLVVSAHWERFPPCIGATETPETIHDFFGFPPELYEIRYPCPGAPVLSSRVEARLAAAGVEIARDRERGLDHGVWVPLIRMYPDADIPVLQLSLPAAAESETLFRIGEALAPLRRDGVLVIGSGGLVHNLSELVFAASATPPPWAVAFDEWLATTLVEKDHEALIAAPSRAPHFSRAHPSSEHFAPVVIAAGAGHADDLPVSFPIEGFDFGCLGMRSVQFG